jgi:hypothetical protein
VLGQRFGLSKDSIGRHAANHLTPQIRAAILSAQKPSAIDLEALQASESEGLLSQLVAQRARLQSHGELALDLGDVRGCVAVEGAITANLGLVGKLLGMLATHHNVTHTSILISADYLKLRATLIDALKPFPAAAQAVGRALHALEAEAAEDITRRAQGPRNGSATAPLLIEGTAESVTPAARKSRKREAAEPSGRIDLPGQADLPLPPAPVAPPDAPRVQPLPPPPC